MYIIDKTYINELIIKNSQFITILIKIETIDEVDKYLKIIKNKYPKATHYCYGYIINDYKKASDDKEPPGTAGIPILNILEHENLTNILAVVVRYFGGIKLGTGGLTRAYSKSIRETLKKAAIIELVKGVKIEITFCYKEQKDIDYLLRNEKILSKDYSDIVKYIALVKKEIIKKLRNYNYIIMEEVYIEKGEA